MDKHEIIRRDSKAYEALKRKIGETLPHREDGQAGCRAWKAACDAFHDFDSPMFEPLGGDGAVKLSAGDPETVDWAISYLEIDPFHFRSGYHKSWLIRRLKRLPLTPGQKRRLHVVVLRALDDPKRAPSYHSRLAASLQTPDFVQLIRWRLESPYPELRQRAQQLLDYFDAFNRSNRRG